MLYPVTTTISAVSVACRVLKHVQFRVRLYDRVLQSVPASLIAQLKPLEITRPYSSNSDKAKPTQVRLQNETGTLSKIVTRRPKENLATKSRGSSGGGMTANTGDSNAKTNGEKPADTDDFIVWIDCEMTGLDYEKDVIMEVACIITGPNLEEIARHPSIVINVPEEKLNSMDAWCTSHHGESGLTEDCKKSQVTTAEAEKMLLSFVQKYTRPKMCPLGGNSIYMDRIFLQKYMPTLNAHLHYRSIDVSTVKELTRRWNPKAYHIAGSKKRWTHRTMDDIEDSINELRYYKANVFKGSP